MPSVPVEYDPFADYGSALNTATPYVRGGGDVVIRPPSQSDRFADDQGQDQTYLQNQAEDRERALPKPYDNMKYRFPSDDLSQGDIVVGLNRIPQVGEKDIQTGVWTGGAPVKFDYPTSRYTNPFSTPEYGIQSGPTNPVIDDRPPEIPPGFSETRGEHSRYRPSALASPGGFTKASLAGDVLGPLATGNARLGQPSSVEGVQDDFAKRIQRMVGDMPPPIAQKFKITSGFRSLGPGGRQEQVNPGITNSRHGYGMAVDTTTDPEVLQWINATNGRYGVDYTLRHLPNEQNHLEMVDNGVRVPLPSGGSVRAVPVDHDPFAMTAEVNKAAAPAPEPELPLPPPSRRSRSALNVLPGQDPGAAAAAAKADLSQEDAVIVRNPSFSRKDVQSGVWRGPAPTSFEYPVSPTTNPFITPEYGIQSSPTNPVLEDRPPQIPPPYSKTRGKQSRYRPPRRRRED